MVAAVERALTQRDDIRTVILAGTWAFYVGLPPGEDSRTGRPFVRETDDFDLTAGSSGNAVVIDEALANTIAMIRAKGRRVVLLGPVPAIDWDVPLAYAGRSAFARPIPAAPTIDVVLEPHIRANAMLARHAVPPAVALLPLAPVLCTPVCATIRDGEVLYTDNNHPSPLGARIIFAGLPEQVLFGTGP